MKAIVLDTNLLLLWIVGLTNPKYIRKHRRLHPTYNISHFEILQSVLCDTKQMVCTAHILTETSNLLGYVSDPIKSEIMEVFRTYILLADESQIESKRACLSSVFIRLGLTDAAITSLNPLDVQILTVDHDLHISASYSGCDVVNLTSHFHG